jgi:hypothetical protein
LQHGSLAIAPEQANRGRERRLNDRCWRIGGVHGGDQRRTLLCREIERHRQSL